jgi:LPXTG-motif cell wall-anchored protein
VDEATAKTSPLALWTATVSSGLVKLTNQAGQSLTYYASGATRYFTTAANSTSNQNLTSASHNGGVRLSYKSSWTTYYIGGFNNSKGYFEAKSQSGSALTIQPLEQRETTTTVNLDGLGYSITNTPLTNETSLKVNKHWDHPLADDSLYEKEQITFKLLANGVDTGRTETANLKNGWTVTFHGLPYYDADGVPIRYTVVEVWESRDWLTVYGDIQLKTGQNPTYETTVTNRYRWMDAFELPGTGGIGHPLLILIGLILVSVPFVYGFSMRRRYRKGARE